MSTLRGPEAIRSLDSNGRGDRRNGSVTGSVVELTRHPLRPSLVALAPTAASVVHAAGGWLFDRVSAGWDVVVLVADHTDPRALEILGVRVVDLETGLTAKRRGTIPHSLALDAELCANDTRIREGLLRVLGHGLADEVMLWGTGVPGEFDRVADPVLYRSSIAARAFKAQAMAAVGSLSGDGPAETLHKCSAPVDRRGGDLIALG